MCAIMGILERDYFTDSSIVERMQKILWHRGPDDNGYEKFSLTQESGYLNYCSVAFDRLSIRDLSVNGHQPMFTYDNKVMIAFNGEIYNSEELRPQLLERGIEFRGGSDTEVILNLYQLYGIDTMLSMLDGMFAICIADFKMNKLYLCRDRIGEKPLYIYKDKDRLMFASEYKAFYCHPSFKPELDNSAVYEYLLFRYVAGEQTFLKGVRNMKPGSYLEFDKDNIIEHQYWSLPEVLQNTKTFEENKQKIKNLVEKSVQRRLISDVPIGLQLSGGVDSSYLCHVVSKVFNKKLNTYCITFENDQFSEEQYIDYVNDQLGLTPRKFIFNTHDFIKYWEKASFYFEAPMNHEGTLALCKLNEEASKEITVMLCGDGPDESMGGYPRMWTYDRLEKLKKKSIGTILWPLIKVMNKRKGAAVCDSIEDFAISRTQYIKYPIYKKLVIHGASHKREVYEKRRKIFNELPGKGIRKFMNYEMHTYMQDILMRSDKISMASSIELRVPYLMPELMEYLCEIPDNQLVDSGEQMMYGTKKILKSLCSVEFGESFTYRDKMGLSFPFIDYFSDEDMRSFVETEILAGVKRRGLINYDHFIKVWEKIPEWRKSNQYDSSYLNAVWCILSFEMWAKMYIDNNPVDKIRQYDFFKKA